MRKLRKFIYWFTEYEDFKDLSTAKKLDQLFWDIQTLAFLLLLILLLSIVPAKVSADEPVSTYITVPGDTCFQLGTRNGTYNNTKIFTTIDSSSEVRFISINTRYDGNLFYYVSLNPFTMYYESISTDENCSAVSNNYSSAVYQGITYYYYEFKLNVPYAGFSYINLLGHYSNDIISYMDQDLVYRYSFGDLSVGGGSVIDYSPVRRIYPQKNGNVLSGFSQYVNQWNNTKMDNLVLYFTRYYKDKDLLCSYWVSWVPNQSGYYWGTTFGGQSLGGSSSEGNFSYSLDNDGNLSISFNEYLTTNYGVTSIYDNDWFSYYTETGNLSNPSDYLDSSNWSVYGTIYSDLSKALFVDSLLGVSNINRHEYTYSDLDIPANLTLYKTSANYTNQQLNTPLYFYINTNESSNYYDYYILVSLADGVNSSVKSIYNARQTSDGTDLTYYSVQNYLGALPVYVPQNDTSYNDINDPQDFESGDLGDSINAVGDNTTYPTEDEYNSVSILGVFGQIISTITDLFNADLDEFQKVFVQIRNQESYYNLALQSFNNSSLLGSVNWINTQADWIYTNTSFNVLINIFMSGCVVAAILF